jgi:hypothetical protein
MTSRITHQPDPETLAREFAQDSLNKVKSREISYFLPGGLMESEVRPHLIENNLLHAVFTVYQVEGGYALCRHSGPDEEFLIGLYANRTKALRALDEEAKSWPGQIQLPTEEALNCMLQKDPTDFVHYATTLDQLVNVLRNPDELSNYWNTHYWRVSDSVVGPGFLLWSASDANWWLECLGIFPDKASALAQIKKCKEEMMDRNEGLLAEAIEELSVAQFELTDPDNDLDPTEVTSLQARIVDLERAITDLQDQTGSQA